MKHSRLSDFNHFMLQGVRTLSDVSNFGIRIDEEYLQTQLRRTRRKMHRARREVMASKGVHKWKKRYGDDMNLDSGPQLTVILFKELGVKPVDHTKKGNPRVDAASLQVLAKEVPFLADLLKMRKHQKSIQYLVQIEREMVDGFIHPHFPLNFVRTYRSSASNPSFQNMPIRDKEQGRTIRRCFIPRKGRQFLESDYDGAEVRVATCYHHDPLMLDYIKDPTKDLHRDEAANCYILPLEEMTSDIRYCGKNKFVFPQFYGSYYEDCAPELWNAIELMDLKSKSGVPLKKHLMKKGIRNLIDFTKHIAKVEANFWRRFRVYDQWRRDWYAQYLKRGFIEGKTGFRCSNLMSRNDCINYPVQGAAFHCLLWSLIHIHAGLRSRGLPRCIVGQIHDSIVMDVRPRHIPEIVGILEQVMTEDIRKAWSWIITPLEIEVELSPPGESWHAKEKFSMEGG